MQSASKKHKGKQPKDSKYQKGTKRQYKDKIGAVTDTRAYKEQKQAVDTLMVTIDGNPAYVLGPQPFTVTGQFACLNTLKVGSGFYERGNTRRIRMKSIRVVGSVKPISGPALYPACTLMLVYDRNSNKGVPLITDILADYASRSGGVSQTVPFSGVNIANSDRFVILRRETWACFVADLASTVNGDLTQNRFNGDIDWYVKLGDNEAHYDGVAGTQQDITSGALFLVAYSSLNACFTFEGVSRLRFTGI